MSQSDITYHVTGEQLYELAHQAAGIGSGAVMREALDVVMPSEEIRDELRDLLTDFLAPIPERYR